MGKKDRFPVSSPFLKKLFFRHFVGGPQNLVMLGIYMAQMDDRGKILPADEFLPKTAQTLYWPGFSPLFGLTKSDPLLPSITRKKLFPGTGP